jgi:hypothetical protein
MPYFSRRYQVCSWFESFRDDRFFVWKLFRVELANLTLEYAVAFCRLDNTDLTLQHLVTAMRGEYDTSKFLAPGWN